MERTLTADQEQQLKELAARLTQRRSLVVTAWRERVEADAEITAASALPRNQFNDHIPALLDALVRRLHVSPRQEDSAAEAAPQAGLGRPRPPALAAGLRPAGGDARVGAPPPVPARRAGVLRGRPSRAGAGRDAGRPARRGRAGERRRQREHVPALRAAGDRSRGQPARHGGRARPAAGARAPAGGSVAAGLARPAEQPGCRRERDRGPHGRGPSRPPARALHPAPAEERVLVARHARRRDEPGAPGGGARAATDVVLRRGVR